MASNPINNAQGAQHSGIKPCRGMVGSFQANESLAVKIPINAKAHSTTMQMELAIDNRSAGLNAHIA